MGVVYFFLAFFSLSFFVLAAILCLASPCLFRLLRRALRLTLAFRNRRIGFMQKPATRLAEVNEMESRPLYFEKN